jgi:microsomal dipeptidase-like Zn-dependent dipeptidase
MIPKPIGILILSAILCVSPALSQGKKASFDGQAAFEYIKVLASDAMQGRKSGEPGGQMAAEYIVSKLKEWGLEPAGPKGSYYQDMTYEYYEVERGATLDIIAHNKKHEFVYGEDWRQYQFSGSGTFGAGIVFVGYGISAAQKGYDDYAGVDVKDKLVLFSIDTPRRFEDKLKDEAQLQNRIAAAREHGARGVMTFRSDGQAAGAFFRGGLKKESYKPNFVVISLETKVVDFIFKWQKADPRYFFQQIEETGKPLSYDLGVQSLVNLKVVFDEKRPTQNVLAKTSGTDETLKNEYVILGAHMDHLGIDMTGDVLNGADDNASGTAVVMEAARVLKLNQFKPKRTVVFALWAAEEEGLLGSKYYTENPVYPLEKTVANINLDMEGHGTGKVRASGAYFAPEVWEILKAGLPKEILDNSIPGRGGPGGSDHTHFLYNGVPAFMVGTDGSHFKTNRVGDVIDLIKPDILKASGDFVVASLQVLSTEPKIPILAKRKETFYWKFETIVNHKIALLEAVVQEHKDVEDPDVDFQLAAIGEKAGLTGDALRAEVMRNIFTGKEKIAQTKGLTLYGSPAQASAPMMGPRGPSKTTVLLGLQGLAAIRDDLRWAEVFSKQGIGYVSLDQPGLLFKDNVLSDEGKKIVEALGKANLLLIVKGLNPAQTKALLDSALKPVMLQTATLPDKDTLGLIRKTESTIGLILGKDEDAASYFKKIEEAKRAVGAEYIAVVSENSLWEAVGKEQMINVIAELLKAGYPIEDLANLVSGAFVRALNRATR